MAMSANYLGFVELQLQKGSMLKDFNNEITLVTPEGLPLCMVSRQCLDYFRANFVMDETLADGGSIWKLIF
jgi:hypothetical protein